MTPLTMVEALIVMLSLVVFVPASVLFIELVSARPVAPDDGTAAPGMPIGSVADERSPVMLVLMPAHDEAGGITPAIDAVMSQLEVRDRLLVVADNCTDATAAIARARGAQVLERTDAVRRGKGFALDAGVRAVESNPPDVVVIVDADCIVAPDALTRLALSCLATARPVQALYLMQAPVGAPLHRRIAEFAWLVKNQVRPSGARALGWPCQLMGTGMAIPWPLLRDAPLASGHLVEDMQLGLDLAADGAPPLFCPHALVTSEFPVDEAGVASQRTRWEHGHLSVIATAAPRLLLQAAMSGNLALLALVLDLIVPPLASLVMTTGIVIVLDAAAWTLGTSAWPLALSVVSLSLTTVGVAIAWRRFGRHVVALRELGALPLYVLAKIPVYARLFTKRQVEWVRTRRDKP